MLIGLDRRCSLEMVIASDVMVDYDKLIDRQLERATITTIAGFAKIFPDASKALINKHGRGPGRPIKEECYG